MLCIYSRMTFWRLNATIRAIFACRAKPFSTLMQMESSFRSWAVIDLLHIISFFFGFLFFCGKEEKELCWIGHGGHGKIVSWLNSNQFRFDWGKSKSGCLQGRLSLTRRSGSYSIEFNSSSNGGSWTRLSEKELCWKNSAEHGFIRIVWVKRNLIKHNKVGKKKSW